MIDISNVRTLIVIYTSYIYMNMSGLFNVSPLNTYLV